MWRGFFPPFFHHLLLPFLFLHVEKRGRYLAVIVTVPLSPFPFPLFFLDEDGKGRRTTGGCRALLSLFFFSGGKGEWGTPCLAPFFFFFLKIRRETARRCWPGLFSSLPFSFPFSSTQAHKRAAREGPSTGTLPFVSRCVFFFFFFSEQNGGVTPPLPPFSFFLPLRCPRGSGDSSRFRPPPSSFPSLLFFFFFFSHKRQMSTTDQSTLPHYPTRFWSRYPFFSPPKGDETEGQHPFQAPFGGRRRLTPSFSLRKSGNFFPVPSPFPPPPPPPPFFFFGTFFGS